MIKNICKYDPFLKIVMVACVATCFVFFAFFYQYHLYFIEQMQLFRLGGDYIFNYFHKPASIACLLGDFLTQFYFLRFGGAVILTVCFVLLWYLFNRSIYLISSWKCSYFMALPLAVVSIMFHFNLLYPLAATISLIIALVVFLLYSSITAKKKRVVAGMIIVPLLYVIAGYAVYIFVIFALLHELIAVRCNWLNLAYCIVIFFLVCMFPLLMRKDYYLTVERAYKYPIPDEIKKLVPDFDYETLFSLDSEWYFNHPDKVIEYARKTSLKTPYVPYYQNLASASLNKLSDNLSAYGKNGVDGMFIPLGKQMNYIIMTLGNELYYFLGDINASEHLALIANTFSPRGESSRLVKRLAETNILKGEYEVAGKYLKMLKQTIFYRGWAYEMDKYLYNEEMCGNSDWIKQKRSQMPKEDHLILRKNYVPNIINLLEDHLDNQAALDYLLCSALLQKDIDSFYEALQKYGYKSPGLYLPCKYQEALLIYFYTHREDKNIVKYHFSKDVSDRFKQYQKIHIQTKGRRYSLKKDFGDTYWYYYNFSNVVKKVN